MTDVEEPADKLARVIEGRHPDVVSIARYFTYAHLPGHLQATSMAATVLAAGMIEQLPDGSELTHGLRRLLEAKDCFVRAALG